jgi:hypothetical protein
VSELFVLSHDDVRRLLPMDECIELMEAALRISRVGARGSRCGS